MRASLNSHCAIYLEICRYSQLRVPPRAVRTNAFEVRALCQLLPSSPQIIAAQEEMLRKERELEEARKKLAQIRQQQYKFLPTELREDEG